MAELAGGTTIGGFLALHSGMKDAYLAGNLTLGGNLTLPRNGEIRSAYNNNYIIKDHNNGNVTISAAGSHLYLGYQNTGVVRLHANLTGSDGATKIADTAGKLYYQNNDIDSRYLKLTGGTISGNITTTGTLTLGTGTVTVFTSQTDGSLRVSNTNGYIEIAPKNTSTAHIYTDRASFYFNKDLLVNGNKVWHAGNDGSGSGLDADLLDGLDSTAFVKKAGDTMTGRLTINTSTPAVVFDAGRTNISQIYWNANTSTDYGIQMIVDGVRVFQLRSNGDLLLSPNGTNFYKVWHQNNDGAGSGLDADTIDGKHYTDIQAWVKGYGLGAASAVKSNLNTLTSSDSGFWEVTQTTQGSPWVGIHKGSVIHLCGANHKVQLFIESALNEAYVRTYQSGYWSEWHRLITDYDLEPYWINLPLINGVQPYSTSYQPRYCKIGNIAFLIGAVKNISGAVTIATLPPEFRPLQTHTFIQNTTMISTTQATYARWTIGTDGTIKLEGIGGGAVFGAERWFPINTCWVAVTAVG